MAFTDADLEGFSLVTEKKPERSGGVTVSQIPAALVKLLEAEAPKALADKDHRLILRLPVRVAEDADDATKAEAKAKALKDVVLLASYATAWGKGQTPKLYLTRQPNPRDEKGEPIVRMKVEKDEEANKRGRK